MPGWIGKTFSARFAPHERHAATLEAAIDRGIAGLEAGQGKETDEVRHALLAELAARDDQTPV